MSVYSCACVYTYMLYRCICTYMYIYLDLVILYIHVQSFQSCTVLESSRSVGAWGLGIEPCREPYQPGEAWGPKIGPCRVPSSALAALGPRIGPCRGPIAPLGAWLEQTIRSDLVTSMNHGSMPWLCESNAKTDAMAYAMACLRHAMACQGGCRRV